MSSHASTLTNSTATYIKRNASRLQDLPKPNQEYRWRDVPDSVHADPQKLVKNAIITHVRTVPRDDTHHNHKIYETRQAAYQRILSVLADRPTLPCGHTGFRSLDDGFECQVCGVDVRREVIEEVFNP